MADAEKPAETIARLTAELEQANKTIAAFNAEKAQASADEKIIREKTAHGLTRDQAIAVIKRQRDHEKAEADAKAAAEAKKAPATGSGQVKDSKA